MPDSPIFVINKKIIVAQSMIANIISESVDLGETAGFCIHAIWTGSPVGNISIQASNDSSSFVEINGQNTQAQSGQHLLNVEKHQYKYVRVVYQFTSGTGVLDVYISGKRI